MTIQSGSAIDPGPGQVQIEVAYVGLCGTDLHILHGSMDARVTMPAVIGHEMSGRISAVGHGVSGWQVGEPVTVMPLSWDGSCPACLAGNQHVCHNLDFVGIDTPGALQQRWNVDASWLVRLPATMTMQQGALVEPVAVAVHDVRRSELASGDYAVVVGGGPIGLLIASVAQAAGAQVLVLETQPARRETAQALGLRAVDPATGVADLVQEWTGGAGADVVFEVSGAPAAVRSATGLLRVRGTLVVVAIHPEPVPLDLKQVFWRELRILGARVYEREDFERAVALVADGSIDSEVMISAIEPLDKVQDAFAALESGTAIKVLVDVQDGAGA
ncbi:MAG: zinc-binding dehydrogenase [Beutenbergiaceae bacterium]